MRMLITYAIIIPVAILVGYLLTNPLDYGTLGFIGIILALILSPIFIKWHYPIMVFGLAFPAQMFFLKGSPPCWEVVVILSLGIALVERALNSEKRFLKAPAMTWALLFTAFMAVITMQLTGGFHLHAVEGEMGGGRKYISLYLGIATFFALISRGIPPEQRRLYIGLYFLSGTFSVISDLFPYLPAPLNYINLLFPPTGYLMTAAGNPTLIARFTSLSATATTLMLYLLARHGLRGFLSPAHPFRGALFAGLFVLSMMGGYRAFFVANLFVLGCIFVWEGLHRTRLMFIVLVFTLIGSCVLVTFSDKMPDSIQRTISFLPVKVDPVIRSDAEGSTAWRLNIWQAILPTVPGYLLLGKGYSLSELDYESMGADSPFAASARANASLESLAISNDFHSGPLSTLICFGVWGGISILAIMAASLYVLYRNFRYGDPALRPVNALLLALQLEHVIHFFAIFGGFDGDVGSFARAVGFSVALNWGVAKRPAKTVVNPPIRPQPVAAELPQAAGT